MRMRLNFFEKTGRSLLRTLMVMGGLIIILNGVQVAMAQWVYLGPPGESVTALAIDPQTPSTLYLGGNGHGVFKSIDGGASWNSCNNGPTYSEIEALAIDPKTPTTIYAGSQSGIYKSLDGGDHWNPINNGLWNSSDDVNTILIDPQTPSTIYLVQRYGVYKSINGGESWTSIMAGLTGGTVSSSVMDPQHPTIIYVGTVEGSENSIGGVNKSTDGGASWTRSNNGITSRSIGWLAIDPQTPTTIYAGGDNGNYRSTDGGANWNLVQIGPPGSGVYALAIAPDNPATQYALTREDGVFKSSDGGGSWSAANTGLAYSYVMVLAIDPQTPATLYAGTYGGVFKSSNSGESWSASNTGLTDMAVLALAIDPQTPTTLYAGTWGGAFKSSNGGGSWTAINSGLTNSTVWALAIDPQTPTRLYAGTDGGGVFKSSNGGGSWTAINSGLTNSTVWALAIDPQTPATLYAASGGVFKSTNGGGSWSAVNTGLTNTDVETLAIDPQTPSTLYAGTYGAGATGGVFKSNDGGGSWTTIYTGSTDTGVSALAIDPEAPATLYAGTVKFGFEKLGGGVSKSSDGGGSWSEANIGLTDTAVPALAIDPQRPASLYAATWGSGVFKSSNVGESWSAINIGLTNTAVHALAIDPQNPSRIYAGTWGGVFVSSVADCGDSISPLNQSYSGSGIASDHVNVTSAGGCGWTAVSHDSWITITSGSSGSGNGVVTFSVAPNISPLSRTGAMTIAGETFTVAQAGLTSLFSLSSISPNTGPVTGGTSVTLHGGGFQVGASVSLGGVRATVNTVTSTEITATTGIASAAGSYDVVVTNPGSQSVLLSKGFTYTAVSGLQTEDVFVPIVLSSSGMNGSFFTSEMTLSNRGTGNATVNFTYTASLGSGSGTAPDNLGPGQQKIVPDAISYLRSLGVPIPSSGSQGGTLRASFSGLTSPADGSVTVRTTTVVPEGRAGLAYAGIPFAMALTGPSYICGLRQNQTDRSNVAVQHVGSSADGNITLQLTVFTGAGTTQISKVLPDQVLPPGGWMQISGILTSNGLSLSNGYVRVERISGTAPYYAYGVINDQSNSDGSFIPPVLESALAGKVSMTLPVVVETTAFSTELVVTNWGSAQKSLNCRLVSDNVTTPDATASFTVDVNPFQQLIWPDLVERLRDSQVAGIGAKGLDYAGALLISVAAGDLSGISVAARTSAAGGGGEYGLFYPALAEGTTTTNTAWLYGLQQNSENRTNLALINSGETDSSNDIFRIELFNGDTGAKVATVEGLNLGANRWIQMGMILSQYAPGVTQGYARITRTGGNNPFIAYAVTNDGAHPGERSGDGAFIASAP